MWKTWVESVMRSAYIWWCSQHSRHITYYIMTCEPKIWGRLLQNCAHLLEDDQTQNQFLCATGYKNRPERKEASILSSEQEMRAGFMVMTQEQSNSHPSGRIILLPSKGVEADEVRLQEHVVCFLEQWGNSSEGVFYLVLACESTVLRRSTKGFCGSCWEKMRNKWRTQDWLLQHDNMPCHTDSRLFPVPYQKKMVVVSGL